MSSFDDGDGGDDTHLTLAPLLYAMLCFGQLRVKAEGVVLKFQFDWTRVLLPFEHIRQTRRGSTDDDDNDDGDCIVVVTYKGV